VGLEPWCRAGNLTTGAVQARSAEEEEEEEEEVAAD
jgi:hypothetical protein